MLHRRSLSPLAATCARHRSPAAMGDIELVRQTGEVHTTINESERHSREPGRGLPEGLGGGIKQPHRLQRQTICWPSPDASPHPPGTLLLHRKRAAAPIRELSSKLSLHVDATGVFFFFYSAADVSVTFGWFTLIYDFPWIPH